MKKLLLILIFGAATLACRDRERAAEREMEQEDEYVTPEMQDDSLMDEGMRTDTTYDDRTRIRSDRDTTNQ